MLQASKKFTEEINKKSLPAKAKEDTIIYRAKNVTTYNDDGSVTIKREYQPINLTKKINETAKLVKQQTAAQKLAELEKILQK